MSQSTELTTVIDALNEATIEEWQRLHRAGIRLNNLGFDDDSDVPLLGLEEMEDELTMEDARKLHLLAKAGVIERDKRTTLPVSSSTPEEARAARENDIDPMEHPAWNDEE